MLLRCAVAPKAVDVLRRQRQLPLRVEGQRGVDHPHIQRSAPAIVRDGKHVVLVRRHRPIADRVSTFNQLRDNLLERGARLGHHHLRLATFDRRRRQFQHGLGTDISDPLEDRHQFREVHELAVPGVGPEPAPIGRKLDPRHRFTEARTPRIELIEPEALQRLRLEVKLHHVHLGEAVRQRRGRRHNDPILAAATRLHYQPGLHEHVERTL